LSNYTKATDFAAKDALLSGNPAKVIVGTEIDDEFSAIQTAVNSKADSASPALTGTATAVNITASGTVNVTGTLQIDSVAITSTAAELNKLDGTSAVTADFDKLASVTASATELNYNDITTLGTVQANKTVTAGASAINFSNFDMTNVDINSGAIDGTPIGAGSASTGAFTTLSASGTANFTGTFQIGGVTVTATAAELNDLAGNAVDAADFTKLAAVTASADELNLLDGVPAGLTTTEIGYLDGVTSAIQTQLDARLPRTSDVSVISDATDTLATGDLGKDLVYTHGTACTVTVPGTLSVGFQCTLTRAGAGTLTITSADNLNGGSPDLTVDNQWDTVYLLQYSEGNWLVAGNVS